MDEQLVGDGVKRGVGETQGEEVGEGVLREVGVLLEEREGVGVKVEKSVVGVERGDRVLSGEPEGWDEEDTEMEALAERPLEEVMVGVEEYKVVTLALKEGEEEVDTVSVKEAVKVAGKGVMVRGELGVGDAEWVTRGEALALPPDPVGLREAVEDPQ